MHNKNEKGNKIEQLKNQINRFKQKNIKAESRENISMSSSINLAIEFIAPMITSFIIAIYLYKVFYPSIIMLLIFVFLGLCVSIRAVINFSRRK